MRIQFKTTNFLVTDIPSSLSFKELNSTQREYSHFLHCPRGPRYENQLIQWLSRRGWGALAKVTEARATDVESWFSQCLPVKCYLMYGVVSFQKLFYNKQLKCTPPPHVHLCPIRLEKGRGSSRKERVVDEDACIMYVGLYLNARNIVKVIYLNPNFF